MNIIVDLDSSIFDGREVVFRSPVDCSQITGLIVYYKENGNTASKEFALADAHGNNVGDIDHLFAENAVVKVILDLETGMAFVQNADTNAYLEGRFSGIESVAVTHKEQHLTEEQKAQVRANIGACRTDNTVVGADAWSSANIVGGFGIATTATGDSIDITDAFTFPLPFLGLSIYGKTTQDGTPTVDAPVELVSAGADSGSITISVTGKNIFGGEALADKLVSLGATKNTETRTVSFTGAAVSEKVIFDSFKPDTKYRFIIYGTDNSGITAVTNLKIAYADGGNEIPKFENAGLTPNLTDIQISNGSTISGLVGRNSSGSKQTVTLYYDKCGIFEYDGNSSAWTEDVNDFEEYKGQILPISTPNGLCGIPVSSGGNYTDENGHQRISDVKDSARGKLFQRIKLFTFDGSDDEKWKDFSNSHPAMRIPIGKPGDFVKGAVLCNRLPCAVISANNSNIGIYANSYGYGYFDISVRLPAEYGIGSDEALFKNWLAEHPLEVMVALAEPEETDLSAEELAQYASLHTYKDRTIVSNDSGAGMAVTYVADTKTYIDNKFAELATAIVNNI